MKFVLTTLKMKAVVLLVLLDFVFTFSGIMKYGLMYEMNPLVKYLWSVDPTAYVLGFSLVFSALIFMLPRFFVYMQKSKVLYVIVLLGTTILFAGYLFANTMHVAAFVFGELV